MPRADRRNFAGHLTLALALEEPTPSSLVARFAAGGGGAAQSYCMAFGGVIRDHGAAPGSDTSRIFTAKHAPPAGGCSTP